MLAWIVAIILGVAGVACAIPRSYPERHPLAGQKYRYRQFGALLLGNGFVVLLAHYHPVGAGVVAVYCLVVLLALLIIGGITRKEGLATAIVSVLVGFTLFAFMPTTANTSSQAQVLTVQKADGTVVHLAYKANSGGASASNPIAGDATSNESDTLPSLNDGKGPVHSWTELVQRVNAMPAVQKDGYIKAINDRSQFFGTWGDVQHYAEIEKTGVDTRVIVLINSDIRSSKARNAVRSNLGDKADTLPFVRDDGALVNSRGIEQGQVSDFADGRSQVRVMLTVPLWDAQRNTYGPDIEAAKKGVGILTECKNPSTGLVHNPKVTHNTPSQPSSVSTTATPSSSPATTTPAPPTETTIPSTETTVPTPPETTTTTVPTCPPGQEGTPPDCLTVKGPVIYPSGKPPVGPPSGDPEPTAPTESNPANPTDQPGAPVTDVPAPGATQDPSSEPVPPPLPTVAPSPDDPGTGSNDPDSGVNPTSESTPTPSSDSTSLIGLVLPAGCGLAAAARKRRLSNSGV